MIALYLSISGCVGVELPKTYSGNEINKFVGEWKDDQNTIFFKDDRSVKWINNNTYQYRLQYKICFLPCSIPYKLEIYAPNNESNNALFDYEFSSDNNILTLDDSIHLYK